MKRLILTRREFINFTLLSTAIGLTGCSVGKDVSIVRGDKTILPKELYTSLSNYCSFEDLRSQDKLINGEDFVILQDGWLSKVSVNELMDFPPKEFDYRWNDSAISLLNSFPEEYGKKFLPLLKSPWVLLFRNKDSIISDKSVSWHVLLKDELEGKIILPKSPYLLISIAKKMGFLNYLSKLKKQAKAFDDRNALNWILSGKAEVAVLPLNYCFPSLFRDPRLSVVLPSSGAPLNWFFMVRPNGSTHSIPVNWLRQIWSSPIIEKIVAKGFLPPLRYDSFDNPIAKSSTKIKSILHSKENILDNCWSLLPLNDSERDEFTNIWNNS